MDALPLLQLTGVECCLQASAGELVLLMGDVGSGKSVWLQRLAGLSDCPPQISCRTPEVVRMCFDRMPPLWLGGTVEEELLFGLKYRPSVGQMELALSDWQLSDVSLQHDPHSLNRLQSIQLALAAIDLARPGLVLLDNPSAALPEAIALDLSRAIAVWAQSAQTIVVVASNR